MKFWISINNVTTNHLKILDSDNVSMTRITQNCNNLVSNGDFGQATAIFWGRSEPSSSKLVILTRQGNHALQLFNRTLSTDAIQQNIATGCMAKGDLYLAQAKIRVLNSSGTGDFNCNPVAIAGLVLACAWNQPPTVVWIQKLSTWKPLRKRSMEL